MPTHLKLIAMALFWAVTPTIARLLAPYEAPHVMAFGRFLVASAALVLLACAGRHARAEVEWKHLPGFVLLGVTGVFLHNVLMFEGVQYTQANNAAVIMGLIVIAVAVLDFMVFGKRPGATAVVGVVIGFLGVAVVISGGSPQALVSRGIGTGDALVVGSALSWAVYSVAGRPLLERFPPILVTCYASVIGTVLLAPFAFNDLETAIRVAGDPRAVGLLVFLGVFGSALGFLWYYQGVAEIGMVNTVIYMNLIPLFGVVAAAVVLREHPDAAVIGGGALVIAALFLVNRTPAPVGIGAAIGPAREPHQGRGMQLDHGASDRPS